MVRTEYSFCYLETLQAIQLTHRRLLELSLETSDATLLAAVRNGVLELSRKEKVFWEVGEFIHSKDPLTFSSVPDILYLKAEAVRLTRLANNRVPDAGFIHELVNITASLVSTWKDLIPPKPPTPPKHFNKGRPS